MAVAAGLTVLEVPSKQKDIALNTLSMVRNRSCQRPPMRNTLTAYGRSDPLPAPHARTSMSDRSCGEHC